MIFKDVLISVALMCIVYVLLVYALPVQPIKSCENSSIQNPNYVAFTRGNLTMLVEKNKLVLSFRNSATEDDMERTDSWLVSQDARKVQNIGNFSTLYELKNMDNLNKILDYLENQSFILTAHPNTVIRDINCMTVGYTDPFAILRFALISLAGSFYAIKNKPKSNELVTSTILILSLFALFYIIFYIFTPFSK